MLELPEQLDATDELESLMEPVLVLEPRLEAELDQGLKLLLPLEVLCLFGLSSLQGHHFANKGSHGQSYGFSSSHVRM